MMVERRRRVEIDKQLARIAEIVEKDREQHAFWDHREREARGFSSRLAHSVIEKAKQEGLSTTLVVGYFLKEARGEAGLTLGELGKRVGLSGSLVCRFERGERLGEKKGKFPSEHLLKVVSELRAPDDVYWALIFHFEEISSRTDVVSSTTALVLSVFGKVYLQALLREGFVPFHKQRILSPFMRE